MRARYGPRTIGQSCLLARRLVERGVPFVTVLNTGWDTHNDLVLQLRDGYSGAKVGVGLVPTFDLAFSALVERPARPRAARRDARGGDGRVRPHAEAEHRAAVATTGRASSAW